MKTKKITASYVTVMIALVMFLSINTFAVSMSDYTALKFGKVTDVGSNTVAVSGKGFLGTTTIQGPDYASAVLYKTPVDPKNFECVITFMNDYGNGEGIQSGWYAINFSKTANWFSPVKAVIQKAVISGVTIIFKLNPNNKKELTMELSRYSPGSGFVNVFGSSIVKTLNNDWTCNFKIKNGVFSVDGNEVLDLGDAFDIAIGSGKTAYVGFGGFSENHYDIKMNVNYAGYTASVTPIPTQKASNGTSSQSTVKSSTTNSSQSTVSTINDSSNSNSDTSTGSDLTSDSNGYDMSDDISEINSDINSDISNDSLSNDSLDLSTASDSTKKSGTNTGIIIAVIVVLIVLGGSSILYFTKIKSKR